MHKNLTFTSRTYNLHITAVKQTSHNYSNFCTIITTNFTFHRCSSLQFTFHTTLNACAYHMALPTLCYVTVLLIFTSNIILSHAKIWTFWQTWDQWASTGMFLLTVSITISWTTLSTDTHKIQLNDSFTNVTDVIQIQMLCLTRKRPRWIKSMITENAIYKFICPCPS